MRCDIGVIILYDHEPKVNTRSWTGTIFRDKKIIDQRGDDFAMREYWIKFSEKFP